MKYLRIVVDSDTSFTVRCPYHCSQNEVAIAVEEKKEWIIEKMQEMASRQKITLREPYQIAKARLRIQVEEFVRKYADFYGVEKRTITIKKFSARWGSCNEKGDLMFNVLLSQLPAHMIEYVVVHEVCHIREYNHSPAFWKLVQQTVPDYKKIKEEMKKLHIHIT